MKIDRVLLASNNNKVYYEFWNPLSKIYREKFGIIPTLVWVGTEEEANSVGISDEYGEIMIVTPNLKHSIPSQCAWGLFWATQFFKDEVCFICGIDEVPLSGMFLKDLIHKYDDDSYIMMIADAYLPDHWSIECSTSPSGQHIAKGSTFVDIYKFEEKFEDEIEKIFNSGTHEAYLSTHPNGYWPVILDHPKWGIDETYFSHILRNYKGEKKIQSLNNFNMMKDRRIDCMRDYEIPYDLNKLRSGWYSQAHLCRPFDAHREYILNMVNEIPKYE